MRGPQEATRKLPFPEGGLRMGLVSHLPPAQQCALLDLLPYLPHIGHVWRVPLSALLLTDALPLHVSLHLAENIALARSSCDQ